MKTYLIILAVVLALTGCTSMDSSTGATHHPKQQTQHSQKPEPQTIDQVFVMVTHKEMPITKKLDDATLIHFGKKMCRDFDRLHLHTKSELLTYSMYFAKGMSLFTSEQSGQFIGFSIAAYCPEYSGLISNGQS